MTYYKTAFCLGIGCHEHDRKNKCSDCGKAMCNTCMITEGDTKFCVNCYILSFPKALNKQLELLSEDKPKKKKHQHFYNDDLNHDFIIDNDYFSQNNNHDMVV